VKSQLSFSSKKCTQSHKIIQLLYFLILKIECRLFNIFLIYFLSQTFKWNRNINLIKYLCIYLIEKKSKHHYIMFNFTYEKIWGAFLLQYQQH